MYFKPLAEFVSPFMEPCVQPCRPARSRWLAPILCLAALASVSAGRSACAVTFSNEQAWDDGATFYYQATYTGTFPHFEVFLDTDNNAATGYTINGIGADYMLEDTNAYKSTANGSGWNWGPSIATVTDTAASGTIKLAVALSAIGSPASARAAFQVLNSSWTPTLDPHVIAYARIPAAPTGLAATGSNTQIGLTWTASSGAASYNVYRGATAGGESTTAIATGITSTSYTNTGLTNGTTYYYKVKAVNAGGTSGYSNEAAAIPSSNVSYYVSPSGNDANPGTLASPWLTSQKAGNSATPGSTVYFRTGVYGHFDVNVSGSAAAGYITFTNYPGETPIIDGGSYTGSFDHGLIHILDQSYIKINGFEVRNGSSNASTFGPCGIFVQSYSNAGGYIQILNNYVHNIVQTAASGGNAHGILVRGEDAVHVLNNVTVSGNTVSACQTGKSESLTVSANVQYFTVSNNTVHDNNNIGIDCTGGYSDGGGAQARNGTVSGNVVYNCSTLNNPYYNANTSAGLYVDGGTNIVLERNSVHHCDYGIELAAETPGVTTSYVTVRSNLVFQNAAFGLGIGGYAATGTGGTDHCTIVNNTFYNNDTLNWWIGEWRCGWRATNNVYANNIVNAGASNDVFFNDIGDDGAGVGTFDYDEYYSAGGNANAKWKWINQTAWTTTLGSWQSVSGQDTHAAFADPLLNTSTLDTNTGSPARNSGNNLGATIEGTLDFAGNPRVTGTIDKGAYEH